MIPMQYTKWKRITDVFLAVFLLILFSPIVLGVIIAIKITSPGPILAETPKRVGMNGKLFSIYKFRSMVRNAHGLLTADPKFRKLYKQYKLSNYKLHKDPRITPVGRVIRRFSLDEVPQLVNVLKGDMSLVGPRPYYPDELADQQGRYTATKPLVAEVLSVRPGITGMWQVSGRSNINFDKRIALDAKYAREKSLFLDLSIIIKTPWAMFSGRGAV